MMLRVEASDGVQGEHKMYTGLAERPYVQCSLLLVLLCTEVLVVGGYKLVERGMAPRSL
jgi:hypothetical protein